MMMIDLQRLCGDLRDPRSSLRRLANAQIREIYGFLDRLTPKSAALLEGWKEDFCYLYGDVQTNLSSNSKLNTEKLLEQYGACACGRDEAESVQLLFFAVQTWFGVTVKTVLCEVLCGGANREAKDWTAEDVIRGRFARDFGIANYDSEDWCCWAAYELENGFAPVAEGIRAAVRQYLLRQTPLEGSGAAKTAERADHLREYGARDDLKRMYEAVIPKELRHALGEFYTPDWLAEETLQRAEALSGGSDVCRAVGKDAVVIDPTCGSGTFLLRAIAEKKRKGCTAAEIFQTVRGFDLNPLAVLTAKTNYLLAVCDLWSSETKTFAGKKLEIPVYQADVLKLKECADAGKSIRNADLIVGNPPWVNWEYMPQVYRKETEHLWRDYALFQSKGRDLSFAKEDICVLITYVVMDKLLKEGGVIAFVVRQGCFKSARNGAGFRRFRIKEECGVQVLRVDDLSKIRAFDNAVTNAAIFYARKGGETDYPVPYYIWEKRDGTKGALHADHPLEQVRKQVQITEQRAMPAVEGDRTSLWITAETDRIVMTKNLLGTNDYRARTGVFTGGANAVYRVRIENTDDTGVTIKNIVERAKRKTGQVTAKIEPEYLYPMVKGSNVRRWAVTYDTYLLCPHTAVSKMMPVPGEKLRREAPKTYAYLEGFREELDARKGFAGWEKEIQKQEFHALLRVGAYTFSKYKVVWKYIASSFVCAVIGSVEDPYLGEKLLLPNEKIMYISTDDEGEAYYLCGILSSTPIAECVKGYMNPTSISAHVLNKLRIPRYDKTDERHREIAKACRKGHEERTVAPYLAKIDSIVTEMLL